MGVWEEGEAGSLLTSRDICGRDGHAYQRCHLLPLQLSGVTRGSVLGDELLMGGTGIASVPKYLNALY